MGLYFLRVAALVVMGPLAMVAMVDPAVAADTIILEPVAVMVPTVAAVAPELSAVVGEMVEPTAAGVGLQKVVLSVVLVEHTEEMEPATGSAQRMEQIPLV